MPITNFVYRGCAVDIRVDDEGAFWEVRVEVLPFDGVELVEPFGVRTMKLAKEEPLGSIRAALAEEIRMAIDHRLVGC
jgi:hypothetical protein